MEYVIVMVASFLEIIGSVVVVDLSEWVRSQIHWTRQRCATASPRIRARTVSGHRFAPIQSAFGRRIKGEVEYLGQRRSDCCNQEPIAALMFWSI
jgi:hypothetical protein